MSIILARKYSSFQPRLWNEGATGPNDVEAVMCDCEPNSAEAGRDAIGLSEECGKKGQRIGQDSGQRLINM